jgi:hypothetical protein
MCSREMEAFMADSGREKAAAERVGGGEGEMRGDVWS